MNINEYREFIKQAYENYPAATHEISAFEKSMDDGITRIHQSSAKQATFGKGINATEHVQNLISEKIFFLKNDIDHAYKKADIDLPEKDIFHEDEQENSNGNSIAERDQSKDAVAAFQKKSKLVQFDENNRSIDHLNKGDFRINSNDIKRGEEIEPDKE